MTVIRLQLYSILKSDWSGAWLLLLIVTQTMNSIVSAGYSCKTNCTNAHKIEFVFEIS